MYQGGGTSSYHPCMLLKVLLYAYSVKVYTGRKIAAAVNLFFCKCGGIWLDILKPSIIGF